MIAINDHDSSEEQIPGSESNHANQLPSIELNTFPKSVTFGTVTDNVHEFALGDNPSVSSGWCFLFLCTNMIQSNHFFWN